MSPGAQKSPRKKRVVGGKERKGRPGDGRIVRGRASFLVGGANCSLL